MATVHRVENTHSLDGLKSTSGAVATITQEMPVVLPIHLRTKAALEVKSLLETAVQSLLVEEPVGYLDMVMLEKHARLVATDSGGVQKEAFFHRVPCVTLRDETEWVELVDIGWNTVIPPISSSAIVNTVRGTLSKHDGLDASPYGDGTAAKHIVRHLAHRWLC